MGNQSTKVDGHSIKYVEERQNSYFGKYKVYEALGHKRQIAGIVSKQDKKFDILDHTSLSHTNLISVLTYDSDYSEIFASKDSDIPFYFDIYNTTLKDIIDSRKKTNKRFEICELNRIIREIMTVLIYYEQKHSSCSHGNLNVNTIFYDRQLKQMKIYDEEVVHGQLSCFYDHFSLQKKYDKAKYEINSYCTPEVAKALENVYKISYLSEYDIQFSDQEFLQQNKQKTDVYLLGLTLLECATYLPSNELYDMTSFQMDTQEIDKRLQIVKQLYGEQLEMELRLMLQSNIKLRPNPSYFTKYISQQQQQQQQLQQQSQQKQQQYSSQKYQYQSSVSNQKQKASFRYQTASPKQQLRQSVQSLSNSVYRPKKQQVFPSPFTFSNEKYFKQPEIQQIQIQQQYQQQQQNQQALFQQEQQNQVPFKQNVNFSQQTPLRTDVSQGNDSGNKKVLQQFNYASTQSIPVFQQQQTTPSNKGIIISSQLEKSQNKNSNSNLTNKSFNNVNTGNQSPVNANQTIQLPKQNSFNVKSIPISISPLNISIIPQSPPNLRQSRSPMNQNQNQRNILQISNKSPQNVGFQKTIKPPVNNANSPQFQAQNISLQQKQQQLLLKQSPMGQIPEQMLEQSGNLSNNNSKVSFKKEQPEYSSTVSHTQTKSSSSKKPSDQYIPNNNNYNNNHIQYQHQQYSFNNNNYYNNGNHNNDQIAVLEERLVQQLRVSQPNKGLEMPSQESMNGSLMSEIERLEKLNERVNQALQSASFSRNQNQNQKGQ